VLKSNKSFLAVMASLPLGLFLNAGFLTGAVVLFSVFGFFHSSYSGVSQLWKYRLLLLPILFFLASLCGILFAEDLPAAYNQVGRQIPLFTIPLVFILLDKKMSEHEVHLIFMFFVLACLACALACCGYAVFQIIDNRSFIDPHNRGEYIFSYTNLTEPVGFDPIYLSMFCNFAVIIAFTSPVIPLTRWRNPIVIFLGFFILLIASKIGIITFLLILLIAIGKIAKRLRTYALIGFVLLIGLVAVTQVPFLRSRFITPWEFRYDESHGEKWNSTTFRLAIWSCSAATIAKHPLMGYGTAGGQKALEVVFREKHFTWGLNHHYNAHNQFISTQLDLGIAGFLIIVAMVLLPFFEAIKKEYFLGVIFLIIIMLSFLVESVLLRQKGIVFFTFFYSLLFWQFRATHLIARDKELGQVMPLESSGPRPS
jgi:O-antigen ligase